MLKLKQMKKILLIIVLFTIFASAESINYAPLTVPVPDIFPARAEIRILDFKIAETDTERFIRTEIQLIFWVGLDKDGKIIKLDENRDSEVRSFKRLKKDVKGIAELALMTEQKPFQTVNFTATAENDGKVIVDFPKISKKTRILPGYYKIDVKISLDELGELKNEIWNENFEFGDPEGKTVIRKRYSPKDVPIIQFQGVYYIGNIVDEKYQVVNILELEFIQKTDLLIKDKENIRKEQERFAQEIKEKKGKEDTLTLERMKMYMDRLLFEIEFYEKTHKTLIAKYNSGIKEVKSIQDYTTKYTNVCKDRFNDLSKDVRSFYTEIYWSLKFCTPGWTADEEYLKKIGKKASEIAEFYNIGKLIKGGYKGAIKKGDWNREIWIARFQGKWSNAIKAINTKFRKFYGSAMFDGKPTDDGYWGIDENSKRTFYIPLYQTTYEAMYDFINSKKFETFIKSASNKLALLHAKNPEEVNYPYIDAETKKPSPDPKDWGKLYKETMSIRTKLYNVYRGKYKSE